MEIRFFLNYRALLNHQRSLCLKFIHFASIQVCSLQCNYIQYLLYFSMSYGQVFQGRVLHIHLDYKHMKALGITVFIQLLLVGRSCFYISCMSYCCCPVWFSSRKACGRKEARCLSVVHSVWQRQKPSGSSSNWQRGAGDIFLQSTDSGSRVSGSMLSVYFIRWQLCLSAHPTISVEG